MQYLDQLDYIHHFFCILTFTVLFWEKKGSAMLGTFLLMSALNMLFLSCCCNCCRSFSDTVAIGMIKTGVAVGVLKTGLNPTLDYGFLWWSFSGIDLTLL